jgi:Rrf2 family nitric oxide-sensitive transcriptional repressor
MYLNQNRSLVTLNELAEKLAISKNNLIKVSNQLAKLGFIESTRGRAGGIWIHEFAGNLSLKEIVNSTESFNLAECFSNKKTSCTFFRGCLLQKSLTDAMNAFLHTLSKSTLNDVAPPRRKPANPPVAR